MMLAIEDKEMKIARVINNMYIDTLAYNDFEELEETAEAISIAETYKELIGHNKVYLSSGCTKLALIDYDNHKVVKFPLLDVCGDPYEGTRGEIEGDYLNDEVEIFKDAKEAGFDAMFVETKYLCNGAYIQDEVKTYNHYDDSHTPSNKALDVISKKKDYIGPKDWFAEIIDIYGEEYAYRFLKYCRKNDLSRDLHCGNVGYTFNNKPVILDYGGYNS